MNDDTILFGRLQDAVNTNNIGITLLTASTQLFDGHLSEILTVSKKSLGVFSCEDKYYFADSHSCGPKGQPTTENGRACVIECDNLQELCRICVDVNFREDQAVQVQQQVSNPISATVPMQTSVMLPIDSVQPDVEDELEVSERLCYLNMRECDSSRKTVFLNTRKPEQRYEVLKFTEAGQAGSYCANERYEKRPMEHPDYNFNNMLFMELAMLFEPHYAKPPTIDEESIDTDAYAS
ncbi:unnamed protein product [Ceutorhynchus assimilis]|uniref:Uncharacterized protein n=1 Tax=Ceutorhynchus assimilis TaxID=467358 RepID=A0A9N9MFZ2_9CUCU|nr:unnamed protein product [Ceutorhynchus assimilis]